jgi:hypothetical protein
MRAVVSLFSENPMKKIPPSRDQGDIVAGVSCRKMLLEKKVILGGKEMKLVGINKTLIATMCSTDGLQGEIISKVDYVAAER